MLSDNVRYICPMSQFAIVQGMIDLWYNRSYGVHYADVMTTMELASNYESNLDDAFYISNNTNEFNFAISSACNLSDII